MKLGRLEAEQWAQEGIANLCEPYRQTACLELKIDSRGQVHMVDASLKEEPFVKTIDQEEAMACIRAAYAQGYAAALTEPAPGELPEATTRSQILALMLPV